MGAAHRRRCANCINCIEEPQFTRDYHDPEKRSIANSLRVELNDGTVLEETVEYPIGHRRRREEGMPLLSGEVQNATSRGDSLRNSSSAFSMHRSIRERLDAMPVNEYVDLYVREDSSPSAR